MVLGIVTRMRRGTAAASIDADLAALVKSSAPASSDIVTGQQRLCVNTGTRTWYYSDGTTASGWVTLGALARDRGAWTASTSYLVGDIVANSSNIYRCKTANSDSTFTSTKWDQLNGGSGGSFSISGLTALTGANLTTSDSIAIDDGGTNKKISYAEFIKGFTQPDSAQQSGRQ